MDSVRHASVTFALLACLSFGLTGCSGPAAGEFTSYSQLEKNDSGKVEEVVESPLVADESQPAEDEQPATEESPQFAPASSDDVATVDTTDDVDSDEVNKVETADATADVDDAPSVVTASYPDGAREEDLDAPKLTDAERRKQAAIQQALDSLPPELRARMLGQNAPAEVVSDEPAEPREIKLLIPEKEFRIEGSENALRVSYDDIDLLKILNMEPVPTDASEHFPDWLNALDNKPVRIRGFMYPTFQESGITFFTLARDNGICCFVRKPKIYDVIRIRLREGEETSYIEGRPFDVVGVFHINPEADDEELFRLYEIDEAVVVDE